MSDALEVLDQVGKWKEAGKGVAVATVIVTWGSSPRPVGSQLGVDDAGNMVGSVSGGCIEGAVIKEAMDTINDGKPRLLDFGVSKMMPVVGGEKEDEVALGRFPVLPTYELVLKCSHLFNLLDTRGALSVTERAGVIGRVRQLACGVAAAYMQQPRPEIPQQRA